MSTGAAWDPSTGQSVDASDLAELLAAAGAVPSVAPTPETPRADALRIDLIMTARDTGHANVVDTFVTSEVGIACDRMCSFLSRIEDGTSHVRIQAGALAAMVCLHHDCHSFQTTWMHRGLAHQSNQSPAQIIYLPEQLPVWAESVCKAFQSTALLGIKVQQLEQLARQRELIDHQTRAAVVAAR